MYVRSRKVQLGINRPEIGRPAMFVTVGARDLNWLDSRLSTVLNSAADARTVIEGSKTEGINSPDVVLFALDNSPSVIKNFGEENYATLVRQAPSVVHNTDMDNAFVKIAWFSLQQMPSAQTSLVQATSNGIQSTPVAHRTAPTPQVRVQSEGGLTNLYDFSKASLLWAKGVYDTAKASKRRPRKITLVFVIDGRSTGSVTFKKEIAELRRSLKGYPINIIIVGVRPPKIDDAKWAKVRASIDAFAKLIGGHFEEGPSLAFVMGAVQRSMTLAEAARQQWLLLADDDDEAAAPVVAARPELLDDDDAETDDDFETDPNAETEVLPVLPVRYRPAASGNDTDWRLSDQPFLDQAPSGNVE